jgi:hypothetical protein
MLKQSLNPVVKVRKTVKVEVILVDQFGNEFVISSKNKSTIIPI